MKRKTLLHSQGCKCLLSKGRYNLQFYPNFSLFSTLGGMNLDHNFFQVGKLSEEQKKKDFHQKWNTFFPRIQVKTKKTSLHPRNGTLFFPEVKYRPALRCTPESNYWRGCRCRPYSNYWGGGTIKLLREYIPPGFGTPVHSLSRS